MPVGLHHCWGHSCAADAVSPVDWRRNLEFVHVGDDSSLTLREEHRGIFNVHQRMPADGTPSLKSIQGTAHTLMNHPACETLGWQFYSWIGIQTQARQLRGKYICTSRALAILSAIDLHSYCAILLKLCKLYQDVCLTASGLVLYFFMINIRLQAGSELLIFCSKLM